MTVFSRLSVAMLGLFLAVFADCVSASAAEIVRTPKGEAHATRLLGRWKSDAAAANRSRAAVKDLPREALRRVPALQSVRSLGSLPGWAVLDMAASPPTRRRSAPATGPATQLEQHRAALLASGLFDWVEPDYVVRVSAAPLDAAYTDGRLWGLRNTGQDGGVVGADINALAAWNITTGSPGVVVAVIDTGIRLTHRDLGSNLWRNPGETPGNGIDDDGNGYIDDYHGINTLNRLAGPSDDHGHGSHVAGTIAASANNDGPHVGVAWEASLMPLKFISSDGSGFLSGAIECIDYAIARGADIINASWGTPSYTAALEAAVSRAAQAGILFVAAAGNNSRDADVNPLYPAGYRLPNVLSVAATDRTDNLAWFSNFGVESVHLAAPGMAVFSCTHESDDSYKTYNGTSMAAPHVAGVAALVLAQFPSTTLAELRQRLIQTTTPVPALAGGTVSGGRVNAAAALNAAEDGILELSARPEQSPLRGGMPVRVFASVSDLLPLAGAQVEARFGGGPLSPLLDNGLWPDNAPGDGVYSGQLLVPTGSATVRLAVTASAAGKTPASREFFFPVVSRPPNDDFASRTATGGGITRSFGTNLNATPESGETSRPATAGGQSVWWSWTAPVDGPATITTAGSDFDTTLAVYRGTALASLELVAENDDSGGLTSAVTFEAEEGVAYAVQVDGYRGAAGQITLNHPVSAGTGGPPVIVEEPFDLSVLIGRPFSLSIRAFGAQSYRWFRSGTALAGETAPDLARTAAGEEDSGVYRVSVSNAAGTVSSREIRVQVERTALRPDHDDFRAARALGQFRGRISSSTELATGETAEPDHAGVSAPLASVWWTWTAPADGSLTLDTAGSNFDTALAVYRGTSLSALAEAASNDDSDSRQARLVLPVTARTTYWIAVDGKKEQRGTVVLSHEFVAGVTPGKVNDFFSDRLPFTGLAVTGSNVGASGEPGEPDHARSSTPLASVWWTWSAPADGTVRFNTLGSNFDTTLAVYTGSKVNELQLIGSNDDIFGALSAVSLPVQAGVSYSVVVAGKEGSSGDIRLNGRFIPEGPVFEPGPPIETDARNPRPVVLRVGALGSWTAASTADWISVNPASGSGWGTVRISIQPNPGTAPREGAVRIAGIEYPVRQTGSPAPAATTFHGAVGNLGSPTSDASPDSIIGGFAEVKGLLRLTVSPAGNYTGKLEVNGTRFSGRGRIAPDGLIDSTWTAGSRRVSVRLQRVGDGSRFYSGQAVVTGEASLEVMAFPATNLSGRTASDFLILRAEESAGPVPDGAATASLSGATLRLAGTLPDGRRFTGAAPTVQLSGDPARQVAFFWLRAGATRLSGWLDRAATTPQEPWTGAWQLFPLRGRFLPGQQPGNP